MDDAVRTVRGVAGRGARPDDARGGEIRGSTTIVEILRMYPGGEAAALMARMHWPCAHCGGAFNEPLTMAAKRHKNSPRAALDAFRALAAGGPSDEQVARAAEKHRPE